MFIEGFTYNIYVYVCVYIYIYIYIYIFHSYDNIDIISHIYNIISL